jgi:16S rRNA (cytosine1402-N4)-methyltransferase
MNESNTYHVPVLLDEFLPLFLHPAQGVFVDGTLGGGGHFQAMAQALNENSILIGLDRDPEAIQRFLAIPLAYRPRIIIEQSPFSEFDRVLVRHHLAAADGILLDLGVSSRQIDAPSRGFSYLQDADLDMRMDPTSGIPAHELIARSSESTLAEMLRGYGEVREPLKIARSLKKWREEKGLRRSGDVRAWANKTFKGAVSFDLLARIFQALRIAVNDELGELKRFLDKVLDFLNPGPRLAVISYHSLEDRMVKTFMRLHERTCICPPELLQCRCNGRPLIKRLTRKAIRPTPQEIARNHRARSARLRIAQRTGESR